MKNWKEEELQHFYAALNEAEQIRAAYEAMRQVAAQLLFPTKQYIESSFQDKRRLLRQGSQSISVSDLEDGEVLRDLAIAWAEVNLHADTSDDDWFEASVDYIFQLGKYGQSRSGLDAFLWHYDLGKQLCTWQQGMLSCFYDEQGEKAERLLLQRTGSDIHPTLGILLYIPNIFGGLSSFTLSEKAPTWWMAFVFFGRLLYTHALCNGIARLEDSGGLWPHLAIVNGAIASWPYPWANDRRRTISLIEKMGSPHYVPQAEPGYFESEAWSQRLLAAAQAYLESFQQVFCERDARDPSNVDGWKQLGTSLQVFSEMVFVYEIGLSE